MEWNIRRCYRLSLLHPVHPVHRRLVRALEVRRVLSTRLKGEKVILISLISSLEHESHLVEHQTRLGHLLDCCLDCLDHLLDLHVRVLLQIHRVRPSCLLNG